MVAKIRVKRRKMIQPAVLSDKSKVEVGFPDGKTQTDVVQRAINTHYGTSQGIPARPFLLNAMSTNRMKYLNALRSSASKLVRGELSMTMMLQRLGIVAQGDVQQEITTLRNPPNSPSTIAKKGSSNPLIDTGEMRGAVTYQVTR